MHPGRGGRLRSGVPDLPDQDRSASSTRMRSRGRSPTRRSSRGCAGVTILRPICGCRARSASRCSSCGGVLREQRDEFAHDLLQPTAPSCPRSIASSTPSRPASPRTTSAGSRTRCACATTRFGIAHRLPTGRRLHEKLADTARAPRARRASTPSSWPIPRATPERVRRARVGTQLDWFFDQWLGPYPRVDYAVADVHSRAAPGGGWDHRIACDKQRQRAGDRAGAGAGHREGRRSGPLLGVERRRPGHEPPTRHQRAALAMNRRTASTCSSCTPPRS